jgi:hypothetical protein
MRNILACSAVLAFGVVASAQVVETGKSEVQTPGSLALLMNVPLGAAELEQCRKAPSPNRERSPVPRPLASRA